MEIPKKDINLHSFEGGVNSDSAPEVMPPNAARYMLNVRATKNGEKGVITNVKGNTLITTPLPSGTNTCIGHAVSEETNKFYFAVWNSNQYHTIYIYDRLQNSISILLQNLTDSGGVDILKFNRLSLILHWDVVQDNLMYWAEPTNKARKLNTTKALDKSITGYGTVITEDFITAYKAAPTYPPIVAYSTDLNRTSNYMYGLLCKFSYRYIYDDGEISNFSDFSLVPLPPNQSYLGVNSITFDNNCVNVQVNTGNRLVKKIEIAVQINSLDFVSCAVISKSEKNLTDNSTYIFIFYNDGAYTTVDQGKIQRAYSRLPKNPACQSFVNNSMTYTNFFEGFPAVAINAMVAVTNTDLYLPPGTVNQLNNPLITFNNDNHPKFGRNYHSTVVITIGPDVKAGNVFYVHSDNGSGTHGFGQSFTATLSDDATTIANAIKTALRARALGIPDQYNGISNESIDGGGNVIFSYTMLGDYSKGPDYFDGSVNPVSFQSLSDNGLSVNVIKSGSTRKYAFLYEDDDGRKSLAYTSDSLNAVTPFITQVGELKMPIHTITIYHQPPVWARWWQVLRTPDMADFIQILIQKVIDVQVTNQGEYLDLVVGSLFVYQKIHPNTVLKYEFERGDRLRLIKNETTKALYTPFFETEVIGYSIDTEEVVNANVTIDGTASITTAKAVDVNYIGKNIQIGNYERTIIGITAGKYQLDQAIGIFTAGINQTLFSTYTFVDRRGIIRIKKPPVAYTVVDDSLIELYKPNKNTNDSDYQIFRDCGIKFEVSDYGTPTRAHRANVQNQQGSNPVSVPAIVKITAGDAYVRNRELPTNNIVPGAQLIVDHVEDPNFSDFYESDLHSLGRVYPQDDGSGEKFFGSRVRFSNNYIEDTKINGLNDFDALDRMDYNDQYDDIVLTRFREGYLFMFKKLRTSWTPVNKSIVIDNSNSETLTTSKRLLNQIQYSSFEGGVGNNPESVFSNETSMYAAYPHAGVFVRIAQNGTTPISKLYNYDKRTREVLAAVAKYALRCYGCFDRENDEAIWSIPGYNNYLYNGGFTQAQWDVGSAQLPNGTTYTINTAPVHGTVSVVSGILQYQPTTDYTGPDSYTYTAHLPDGSTIGPVTDCISVVDGPVRPSAWRNKAASAYCIVRNVAWRIKAATAYCVQAQVTYYNVRASQVFARNNCSTGYSGTTVEYVVAANTYNSIISQADADGKATADIAANGQNYANTTGTCIINSEYSTLLIDYYVDTAADLCIYCSTSGISEQNSIAASTANGGPLQNPNDGRDPADCFVLSSDKLVGPPVRRFGVNLAYFIAKYPAIDHFTFVVRGRSDAGKAVTGIFAKRDITAGHLTMGGATGQRIPGVSIGSPTTVSYSSNIVGGADGTVGSTVGSPILTLDFIVSTNSITATTY